MKTLQTKSAEEIAELKRQWLNDACWNIYETEGFEAHKEELKKFQEEREARWEAQYKAKELKEQEDAKELMLAMGLKYPEQYPIYKEIKFLKKQVIEWQYTIDVLEYHVKKLTGLTEL